MQYTDTLSTAAQRGVSPEPHIRSFRLPDDRRRRPLWLPLQGCRQGIAFTRPYGMRPTTRR